MSHYLAVAADPKTGAEEAFDFAEDKQIALAPSTPVLRTEYH